jgi:hypothetical protein
MPRPVHRLLPLLLLLEPALLQLQGRCKHMACGNVSEIHCCPRVAIIPAKAAHSAQKTTHDTGKKHTCSRSCGEPHLGSAPADTKSDVVVELKLASMAVHYALRSAQSMNIMLNQPQLRW